MSYILFDTIYTVIRVLKTAAMISILLSWFAPRSRVHMTIDWLLSPLVQPFRILSMKLTARMGIALDFGYFFFFVGLNILETLLYQLQYRILL